MKRAVVVIAALAASYALLVGAAALWARFPPTARTCPTSGSVVLVDTTARVLCLCRDGHVDERFSVALGRGGIDKRSTLDGKTPLGRYPLGNAIPSSRFHLFLPVGYPNSQPTGTRLFGKRDRRHGPHAAFAWLRQPTVWPNRTQGCPVPGAPANTRAGRGLARTCAPGHA